MYFSQVWPLALLLFIPLVILMYLLKQKAEDYEYSSTFLWEEVYKNYEVNTPWERLKKNLLLFVQILLLLLFVFALLNPFFLAKKTTYENVVIVLDNSGSMNTDYENHTRFVQAKNDVKNFVKSLSDDTSISLITTATAKLELAGTKNKEYVIEKLDTIHGTDRASKMNDVFGIIQSLGVQWDNFEVFVFTDQEIALENIEGQIFSYNNRVDNMSIDYLSHGYVEGRLDAIVRITNHSEIKMVSDINLYGDDVLLDIQRIALDSRESQLVFFQGIDFEGNILRAEINEEDGLRNDNIAYDIITQLSTSRVLLVTEKNVFLEKLLNTFTNIEVYKTHDTDNIGTQDDYDLYIFDGLIPEDIPTKGNLLFLQPTSNKLFRVYGVVEGGRIESIPSDITALLSHLNFGVRQYYAMELPLWAESFFTVEDTSVGFFGSYQNQRIATLGFSLHDTDFVLKPEFPILMHELLGRLMDTGLLKKNNFRAGEQVSFNMVTEGSPITVKNPDQEVEDIPLRYPIRDYENTEKVGVYSVYQEYNGETREALFVVNFPAEQESFVKTLSIEDATKVETIPRGKTPLLHYIISALLLFLLVEWVVYIKKY